MLIWEVQPEVKPAVTIKASWIPETEEDGSRLADRARGCNKSEGCLICYSMGQRG